LTLAQRFGIALWMPKYERNNREGRHPDRAVP